MENSSAALLWEEQQLAARAQRDIEHREWLKSFALLFVLIVLTLIVATVLANLGTDRMEAQR